MDKETLISSLENLGNKLEHIKSIIYAKNELLETQTKEIAQSDKMLQYSLGLVVEHQGELSDIILDYAITIDEKINDILKELHEVKGV